MLWNKTGFHPPVHTHASGLYKPEHGPQAAFQAKQAGLSQMATPIRQADRLQRAHVSQQMACERWQSQASHRGRAHSGLGLGTAHLTTGCPMPATARMAHRVPSQPQTIWPRALP